MTALALVAAAAPSAAAVTIGHVAPTTPPSNCSNVSDDWVQPIENFGASYAVPDAGGITSWTIDSWSTMASTKAGQHWTMKIFRHLSGPNYTVVAHDGPRDLDSGVLNTFAVNMVVRPGDLLGMNDNPVTPYVSTACETAFTGDTVFFGSGDLADGETGPIGSSIADRRLNISAVAEPTNTFSLGQVARNKKKGTGTITVTVPNPGALAVSGTGVKAASVTASTGDVQLPVAAAGKKRKTLKAKGKAAVGPIVTFTPTGGEPSALSTTIQLKKKRPRR
jgi:hypothetical protein